MKALVVYDSQFGNTEKIAQAIGEGLRRLGDGAVADVVRIGSARPEQVKGLDLLVVGSPTQGFRPTVAIASFLKNLPEQSLADVLVAAFDTRIDLSTIKPAIFRFIVGRGGYAAKPIGEALIRKGGRLAVPAEGFIVLDREGPLAGGELARAGVWAQEIASTVADVLALS